MSLGTGSGLALELMTILLSLPSAEIITRSTRGWLVLLLIFGGTFKGFLFSYVYIYVRYAWRLQRPEERASSYSLELELEVAVNSPARVGTQHWLSTTAASPAGPSVLLHLKMTRHACSGMAPLGRSAPNLRSFDRIPPWVDSVTCYWDAKAATSLNKQQGWGQALNHPSTEISFPVGNFSNNTHWRLEEKR